MDPSVKLPIIYESFSISSLLKEDKTKMEDVLSANTNYIKKMFMRAQSEFKLDQDKYEMKYLGEKQKEDMIIYNFVLFYNFSTVDIMICDVALSNNKILIGAVKRWLMHNSPEKLNKLNLYLTFA